MDPAVLLDLLGNENRRRILRLLAHKPCYVTEISEYLGVSPKAVIDHLRKLEDAGLIESRVDDQRRKYFSIARNLRLEVNVSPYGFGTKSAYPTSRTLDTSRWRYLSIELSNPSDAAELAELAREIGRLEELARELSMAQRWVQGRLTEAMGAISKEIRESSTVQTGTDSEARFYAELLSVLAGDGATIEELTKRVEAAPSLVEEALYALAEYGIITREGDHWKLQAE
jgi:ArsR family transcriptional regulator